ncbi:uncharacterized protein C8R40DRAFT_1104932 [Lentinula edodes]|uniref:uncharacterized protein n=1 Tax=Lentinula edodes TaxID=5353 RepID=UPI001E8E31A5|nr:uncharacterized protein C8R40DRAFT_1104932 [Lentinula edodes]KAH7875109.1 hypothetical protein C8R40DRAFT_1104932 [Lentinula edodes]
MSAIFPPDEIQSIQRASRAGTRMIRDSDISSLHLDILIEGGKKLNSSIMNAVAAQIQLEAEAQGESPAFCVFSSWLGPHLGMNVEDGAE